MTTCASCGAPLADDARFCSSCGAAVVLPAGRERKLATLLFADLVGSTTLGEGDPEQTRALLERFYDAMAVEVERAGGTVEKFVGDAVMAAFGAPTALEDHAERALHAALSMQGRLAELGDGLALRIGVNTGDVVVGGARAGGSFVTGDAVNVAKRLEEAAAPGEILAGARTAAAAGAAFAFGDARELEARGKTQVVVALPVLRAVALTRPRGVGGLGEAFVGRETELELLCATYRRVLEQREPHLVTLMGDAGVGKTRLAREFWDWLARCDPQPLRRAGRSLPYGGVTYWALAEVLKEHVGLLDSDGPDVVRARLAGLDELVPTLGLELERGVHPFAAQERLHEAWTSFLSGLVASGPAVVLVEELHWAEEPLLTLLERLLRDVQGPLLLVATSRPELLEQRPSWGGGRRNSSLVWLNPLGARETLRLVDELVAAELPASLRERIVERADGNPFVVEELLGALIDRGALRRSDGRWHAPDPDARFDVPDTVHALIAARIDLLPPREKAGLQAASVIGRVFWAGPVQELLDGDEPDWRLLEDRDFVRRGPCSSFAGEVERAFKHAYTREVAYASLPRAKRARLHAALAAWLQHVGSGGEERAAFLAHHYTEAARPEDAELAWAGEEETLGSLRSQAVAWSLTAARGAASRYELADARELLVRVRDLAPPGDERATVLRVLAGTYALAFAGEEFWTGMQDAIAEAESPELEADLYADLAFETACRSGIWKRMPDRSLVEGWIERALAGSGPEGISRTKALIAQARWRPDVDGAAANEASVLAERLDDPILLSAAWDTRGVAEFVAGRFEEGRVWAGKRFELLDRITDPDARADIHAAPITGYIWSGDFAGARRLARMHDEIASELTPHHRVHAVAIDIEVEELLGDWSSVRGMQERAEELIAENAATPCVRNPRSLLVCALARELAGDAAAASRLEGAAMEQWMDGYGFTLDTPLLRLALARGDLGEVERLAARPETEHGWHRGWFVFANVAAWLDALAALGERQRVERLAAPYLDSRSYLEPFALRALGQVRGDENRIRAGLARFEELGLEWHAAQTRALVGA